MCQTGARHVQRMQNEGARCRSGKQKLGGGGGGRSTSIENPVHGLFLRTELQRKHTTSVDRWRGSLKSDALRMLCDEYRGGRRYGD